MKALVATEYQSLDHIALTELPTPSPAPGQVLVQVEAAALNPLDLLLITGAAKDLYPAKHPLVIGMDVAGTVMAVGDEVVGYVPGDSVLAFTGQAGAVAEYTVVAPGPRLAHRPSSLDAVHAAAIPESGMTAVCLLRAVGLGKGENILVIGATGGVGLYAVQLASSLGARVIATAGGQDIDYVRELGAAEVIDYRADDVIERTLALAPGGVDVALDLVNRGDDLVRTAQAVHEGGRLVSPLYGPEEFARDVSAVYIGSFDPNPGDLQDLADRAAGGQLRVEIGKQYPFTEAVHAVAEFAGSHSRGKTVITLP